jgi:hypothetical protein
VTNVGRRRLLQAAAGSLFLPVPYAHVWAQSEGAVKLLRLPKIALVLGNSRYAESPLKNPANDARAIGEALTASGFAVTTKLDAGRADMVAAIDAYVKELAAKKCVGLFYYAGHGIQLAWKNYMLPVDAEVDTVDDVQKQAVEVNNLMSGLTKAANPLNVIILDACRDNPFGSAKQPQQKGLSQMDAPSNTILAYATSPGNVASDGDGTNGLYTENLLREIKVPEAKLEDVFKRVRLGVRRRSNGAQIPWESTSLEDDFWFIPPKELKKQSEAERERHFREELAHWEKIQTATEPGPLEAFLRRYPNGDFSDLAQLQLDRVLAKQGEKKIEIAAQAGNPYTKGSAVADTRYKVGDTYDFRVLDVFSKVEQSRTNAVITRITDNEVIFSNGSVTDLLGNIRRHQDGRVYTPNQNNPLEFSVGRRWISRFVITFPGGRAITELEFHIVRREPVTVPAGTFNAFLVESRGWSNLSNAAHPMQIHNRMWFAPDQVRLAVLRETERRFPAMIVEASRTELVSFRQG